MAKFLNIAIPTFQDWDGVIMTLTSLKLYHKDSLRDIKVVILDNTNGTTQHSINLQNYVKEHSPLEIDLYVNPDVWGTAAAKNYAISKCDGEFVLTMDSHIMLPYGVIDKLIEFFKLNRYTDDLYQGPYIADTGNTYVGNCFKPVWSNCMYGQWDNRPYDKDGKLEILMQGMGLFAFRRVTWLKFHELSRGFGGEEYYIHEKYRQAGRKCWSLNWLEWWHRCGHVNGVKYSWSVKDVIWNYLLSNITLGYPDYHSLYNHFVPQFVSRKRFTDVESSIRKALEGHKYVR